MRFGHTRRCICNIPTPFRQRWLTRPCFDRDRKLGPLQVLLTMQAAHFASSREGGQSWEDALESVRDSFTRIFTTCCRAKPPGKHRVGVELPLLMADESRIGRCEL